MQESVDLLSFEPNTTTEEFPPAEPVKDTFELEAPIEEIIETPIIEKVPSNPYEEKPHK